MPCWTWDFFFNIKTNLRWLCKPFLCFTYNNRACLFLKDTNNLCLKVAFDINSGEWAWCFRQYVFFLSGHDRVSRPLLFGFWACVITGCQKSSIKFQPHLLICVPNAFHTQNQSCVCVCPVHPFCVNVFAEVHKLPLCSFPFSVPHICVPRAETDEEIRELEWRNESVRQRDRWGRERENEMGVKGNEIERNIFSTSPNPKRKEKKKRKKPEKDVYGLLWKIKQASFFLVCLIWGGLWEVKGAQVAIQFLRLCCLNAVWRFPPDEPWKTWRRRCHFRRVALHDCQEEKWKEK